MMTALAKRSFVLLICALTIAGFAGCGGGESQLDVVKKFRPQYEAFAKQLTDMAGIEPKAAVLPPAPLDPKPVLKRNDLESNTAVFMFDQLRDPCAGLKTDLPWDMGLSGRVLTQIRVGTASDADLPGKATKNLSKELTDGLNVRYIGAVKILSVKPAVVVGTDGFNGGNVKGVVMLFDRQTMKPVFADAFTGESDKEINYTEFKGEKIDNKGLQGWVDGNLRKNVKKAVLKKFSEGTGGVFESDVNY